MRLAILDTGHSRVTKMLFGLIRAVSRQPVLDVIKLAKYRAYPADPLGKDVDGQGSSVMPLGPLTCHSFSAAPLHPPPTAL